MDNLFHDEAVLEKCLQTQIIIKYGVGGAFC